MDFAKKIRPHMFIFLFIPALVLRFYGINKYGLWFDELVSNFYSCNNVKLFSSLYGDSPFHYCIKRMLHDPASIMYYLTVYAASFALGEGQALRILSVIFSSLSLWVFYRFSRLFFNKRISLFSVFIMAFSPMQVWYAQEARVYAMALFLVLLTVYLYVKSLRKNSIFYLVLFTLSFISALYASYFSLFLLIPMAVIFKVNRNAKNRLRWLFSGLFILLAVVPLFFVFIKHLSFVRENFWISVPSLRTLLNTSVVQVLGYSSSMWQIITAPVIFSGIYAYGVYAYYRSKPKGALFIFLLFFPVIAVTYILSRRFMPLYLDRQIFIYSPFYYLFIAKGTLAIKRRLLRKVVTILIIAYMANALINYYNNFLLSFPDSRKGFYPGIHARKDYKDLISFLKESLEKGDAVFATDIQSYAIITYNLRDEITSNKISCLGYMFYPYAAEYCLGTKALAASIGINGQGLKPGQLYARYFKGKEPKFEEIFINSASFKRVWLVSSSWHKGTSNLLLRNSTEIRKYTAGRYVNVLSKEKDGIYIDLFDITHSLK